MITIKKGQIPNSLVTYKKKIGASYKNLDSSCKKDIRQQLLEEQGHLCAYCMSRISERKMKIEHYESQSLHVEKQLDYGNMLGVCKGGEGLGYATCDTARTPENLKVNPQQEQSVKLINYRPDGTITSDDDDIKHDLQFSLNLNHPYLKHNRREANNNFIRILEKKRSGTWKKTQLETIRKSLVEQEKRMPYCGIILFNLDRKLRRS